MRFHVNQQRNLINKLDEQLKEIRKCHHQKYLNTKPIINNINKNSCLEQKCELVKEKNNGNIETFIEYKIDSKVARSEEAESAGETNSREKPPPEISKNFHEMQINFHDSENDNNEENQLIVAETNIANNNNEDNRMRNNGSNAENGINKSYSAFKASQAISRQISIHFRRRYGERCDGYLLTGSLNRKFDVKVRPLSSAKTIDMEDYTKPTKREFNADLYILH